MAINKLIMTSTKRQTQFKRSAFIFLVTLIALSLSACGGGKKIITSDDSADYKSARSLPPLKKPSPVAVSQSKTNAQAATDSGVVEEPSAEVAGKPSAEVAGKPSAEVAEKNDALASAPATNAAETSFEQLSATVVDAGSGQAKLEVAAEFDRAWDYLNASLQQSDLTVFSRNKQAGRFSIGCADIEAAPTVVKSGRWSFFNRDKQQVLEYCALQAVEKRSITIVSVLNQAGEEVSGEYSKKLFSRILQN
ncbi:MAG: putative lipoprotein [Paracoccaceae bacterium]